MNRFIVESRRGEFWGNYFFLGKICISLKDALYLQRIYSRISGQHKWDWGVPGRERVAER